MLTQQRRLSHMLRPMAASVKVSEEGKWVLNTGIQDSNSALTSTWKALPDKTVHSCSRWTLEQKSVKEEGMTDPLAIRKTDKKRGMK